ncbi:rhomboid family intramembrane serine protease [Pseudofulvimonas gallinarii]|uniref:Membrane associated rhomboid family serine protease n=1 Tax=Pseudofulvimonas gallinarii TaxID=634155 RepID=A0A4R3LK42_9GAMM|nr:rhomboid family intramembrane serine protease [Pseudofulvimonas gallinarii]TCT00660.1 membrane associated rhomboid family serine protease [Pseudofulvimonas gallinarii]THD12045.1 hypothetical protein B1808_13875 [Pseudofulvimonas gallinarii]
MHPPRPVVSQALLVVMAIVFGLQQLWPEQMLAWFGLWPDVGPIRVGFVDGVPIFAQFETWQYLTHGFLHGGAAHLLMNGLALYMFGSLLELAWGGTRYLVFFLACVVGGGLMQAWWIGVPTGNEVSVTLGASGGAFGILAAFALLFPRHKVLLLIPPVPMPAWLLVTLFAMASTVMGITGLMPGIAHFAHLGGLLAGLLLYVLVARNWWQPGQVPAARRMPTRPED